ncbi:hypothetical protein ACW9UR_02265 [Halovulum sp. GXIMD14794]
MQRERAAGSLAKMVLYYKTHLAVSPYGCTLGFVLQRLLRRIKKRQVHMTAPSTGAEDAGKARFHLVLQERHKLGIAPLILVGDVKRDNPAVGWALLVLLPDAFAVAGLHCEDQIGTGDKLLGQQSRRFGVRAY